jgi:hypothetical protein
VPYGHDYVFGKPEGKKQKVSYSSKELPPVYAERAWLCEFARKGSTAWCNGKPRANMMHSLTFNTLHPLQGVKWSMTQSCSSAT